VILHFDASFSNVDGEIMAGEVFQAYDYEKAGNLKRYGTKRPLKYNLQQVTVPVRVI
jgi:hypothetical protein